MANTDPSLPAWNVSKKIVVYEATQDEQKNKEKLTHAGRVDAGTTEGVARPPPGDERVVVLVEYPAEGALGPTGRF